MNHEFDFAVEHVRTCKLPKQRCPECLFLTERLERKRSWLFRGAHGYGCRICRRAKLTTLWAIGHAKCVTMLKKQSLDRHQACTSHLAALADDATDGCLCPTTELFERVWGAMAEGLFAGKAIARRCGIGKAKVLKIKARA